MENRYLKAKQIVCFLQQINVLSKQDQRKDTKTDLGLVVVGGGFSKGKVNKLNPLFPVQVKSEVTNE